MKNTDENIETELEKYMADMDLDLLYSYVYSDLMKKMESSQKFFDTIVKENNA